MSENSSPPVSISKWLLTATRQLPGTSARLDALLLLSEVLQEDKAWILSHDDHLLTAAQLEQLKHLEQRRKHREPLAYIRGKQEFFGRDFTVNPAVLIPRPESEALIESILKLQLPKPTAILDVGTGSGALAITLALELPGTYVEAIDSSTEALAVARHNAKALQANVTYKQSDLLQTVTGNFNVVVANLPYVSTEWERSPETDFEPSLALFANQQGLSLILKLLAQAPNHLLTQGYLILEADPRQHRTIAEAAQQHGFVLLDTQAFCLVLQKAKD